MGSSRALSAALWVLAGLIVILCLKSDTLYAHTTHSHSLHQHEERNLPQRGIFIQAVATPLPRSVPIITHHSPGHQNPVVAPPQPLEQALKASAEDAFNATLGFTPNPDSSQHGSSTLSKRDDGPLYCTGGPCIDGSCCGKNNICGYGPDYCGEGCQSQCDATAMCGEFSENAEMPCGMNLCCSATGWCGTTSVYCDNADPAHGTLPCQAGYGSCQTYSTPSCAAGSGSTDKRRIGYYQSWNVRERKCNTVHPKELDTSLYTHLFYAFASIDPTTFTITNAHPDDENMIPEFTGLKSDKLQTWVAVGGFDFSDTGPTHTTWSNLCASKANRAAFISSVKAYMDKYGFQGIDLDWEYPGAPERGGNKLADVRNFPMLVREMRAAFGTSYGISLTLAPDYWYLRWFDAKSMESSVDFFGFMAYDLHGYWDQDVKTLTKIVRGQADIREISTDTTPLWFDGLDPSKINFGLAMYGRGYTLSDASCNTLGCSFAGPSKPGPCTGFDGVLSLWEIKDMIKNKGYQSTYLPDAMMKQLTFDDQWIGYDDEETFAAKKAWADSRCFGGSMVWGIDYGVGGTGGPDDNVVYLGTPIYSGVNAQCTAPCHFVLPPSSLATPTTISILPYTTTLQVAAGVTTTITITVNAITTTAIPFSNVDVTTSTGYTITPSASIDLPPVITTLTISGTTQVRTLTLPPWPAIVTGDSPSDSSSTSDSGSNLPWPTTFPNPPDQSPIAITSVSKTDFTPPTGSGGGDATTTTSLWPVFTIGPVETDVPESGEDSESTCTLWFFWVCVDWVDLNVHIHGWKWTIPPGIWGPGPPPIENIELPPGFEIRGTLPKWPRITIPTAGPFPTPDKPADCTPAEASLCYTTSSFGTTVTGGSTKTTATQVTSRCATITGCDFRDAEATVTRDACSLGWGGARRALPTITAAAGDNDLLLPRQTFIPRAAGPDWACDHDPKDAIVLVQDPTSAADREKVTKILKDRDAAYVAANKAAPGFDEVSAPDLGSTGVTGFYYVKQLGVIGLNYLNSKEVPEIATAYYVGASAGDIELDFLSDDTSTLGRQTARGLQRRAMTGKSSYRWHLSQLSFEPGKAWDSPLPQYYHDPANGQYSYAFDDNGGKGQTIYIIEKGMDVGTGEIDRITRVPNSATYTEVRPWHGYYTAAFAAGTTMGVAPEADLFWVQISDSSGMASESVLQALLAIGSHVDKKEANGNLIRPKNSVVVSMSFGLIPSQLIWRQLEQTMQIMEEEYGVMFVASAGNQGEDVSVRFPRNMSPSLKGMMVVGAVDKEGATFSGNGVGATVNILAPGVDLPKSPGPGTPDNAPLTGTSFAAPMVAGLVAYLRAHPFFGIQKGYVVPGTLKAVMEYLERPLSFQGGRQGPPSMAYNGAWIPDSHCSPNSRRSDSVFRRQDGGEFDIGASCPAPGSPGGNGGGTGSGGQTGPPVTFQPGTPGPICSANCGTLSADYSSHGATPTEPPIVITALPTLSSGDGSPNTAIPSDCTSTTTWASCALGLPPGESACQTFSSCAGTAQPTTTAAPPPKPTWTAPSGFPSLKDLPDTTYSCATTGATLNWAACDTAAKEFFQDQPDKMYWGTREGNGQVCVTGTDGNGQPAGCMIHFALSSDAPADETRCGLSGTNALQWYTDIMSNSCEKPASLSSKGGCVMMVMTDLLCKDT